MSYWQADHDRQLIDDDAPSWAHHLAEISAVLLDVRSMLTGNGIEYTLPEALDIVRMVLNERLADRERALRQWDQGR